MNPRDTYILTHYSEITDAKKPEIRHLQAEVVRSLFRGMAGAIRQMTQREQHGERLPGMDEA